MVNQKVIAVITTALILSMVIFSGCGLHADNKSGISSMPNSEPNSERDSTIMSSQQTNSYQESSAADFTDDIDCYFENAEKYILGDRTYYLDKREEYTYGGETGYRLYYKDNIKGTNISLNIPAFSIMVYGEHLYILTEKSDDLQGDNPADDTVYRLEQDGSKKFICNGDYYSLMKYALCRDNNSLYFTRSSDNAVFKADLNCEKIERIPVNLPGQAEIFTELKITKYNNLFFHYTVDKIKNGFLYLNYYIVNSSYQQFFTGKYKMPVTNHQVIEESSMFEDCRQRVGDWIFYLDLNHPIEMEKGPVYEIHRINPDGSGDVNLKIQCFQFDFAENYIYANADRYGDDFAYWYTYRYNPDGSGKKKLPYHDMLRYYEGGRIYFTENWEKTLYVADTACNVLMKTSLIMPDDADLREKLGYDSDLVIIRISDKEGDWLNFSYRIMNLGGELYYGTYRINLVTKKVEKISGEYTSPEEAG